jgi:hypothetical protein
VRLPPEPAELLKWCAIFGFGGGAIAGLVLGLHYLPTVPFAIVEGAILF